MSGGIITPHGGYRDLKSFQTTTIIYDFTVEFCEKYVRAYRMQDQMIQAARSGRQNIAEGCQASGTSKKTELKLVSVARASLEELLLDYEDFLRQRGMPVWEKSSDFALEIRRLAYLDNRSYRTYRTYIQESSIAANAAICLIHQANYLLDKQLQALDRQFVENGGFNERMYSKRKQARGW
ncbi:four helix bundle protein [Candidatus Uhrbacteria bacterium]|jgi:restriction system protein|nr:four helix bundle protein [Candidatus Uhrbacteria bacterium]